MKRTLVGLDLNGYADFAARDQSPDDPDVIRDLPAAIAGGIAGDVVVTFGDRRIAGAQAALAPHGRGEGWGAVGAAGRRRALAPAVDDPRVSGAQEDLQAAIAALARGADEVVIAVPDLHAFDETRQGAMIRAGNDRRRRARLLWRPVAAFLDLLADGIIPANAIGARYRLLVHGGHGLEEQMLTLVQDPDHPLHQAPQRDSPGHLICPDLGLGHLFAAARRQVHNANSTVAWDQCEPSRLGPRLVCGCAETGLVEILRNRDGTWTSAVASSLDPLALLPVPAQCEMQDEVRPAERTFLVTPLVPNLAERLAETLSNRFGPITPVRADRIAKGALRAGRLIEQGLPHYYDCLQRIAIAVMEGDDPVFADLIAQGEPVPANREFVSAMLHGFNWPAGKNELQVYILKGTSEVRHWKMRKDKSPGREVPVRLRVRQTPGQSWARLTVSSNDWDDLVRAPVELDWEACAPVNLTPEQVLDTLRHPPPKPPERIVERSHVDLWLGAPWAGAGRAANLARQALAGRAVRPADWAKILRQSRRHPNRRDTRLWHIGTDGDLPVGLPDDVRSGFAMELGGIATRLMSPRPQPDNTALIAATWCFAACPSSVQDRMVEALEAQCAGQRHPLLAPFSAATVLRQGAGRAISGVDRIRRVLRVFDQTELNSNSINGLAMLLARREEAPQALDADMVDRFLRRLVEELANQVGGRQFKQKFRNTLSALAALFRWREVEPFALLAKSSSSAAEAREILVHAKALLDTTPDARVSQRHVKIDLMAAIIEFLDGRGDPDILRRFVTEDDDDEPE